MKRQATLVFLWLIGRSASAAIIASGSGSVAAAASPTTSYSQKAEQALVLADFSVTGDLATNQTMGLRGTMTMSPSAYPNIWNDQLVLGFANPTGAWFPTQAASGTSAYALNAAVSAASGSGAPVTVAQSGTITTNATLGNMADSDRQVDYAINITLASNWEDGSNAANGHIHTYEMGLDFNSDGIYDYTESGSFSTFENDRFRLGFGAIQGGGRATPEALTNSFSYTVYDVPVDLPVGTLPQPVVWLDAAAGVGLDSGVVIWTNLAAPGTFNAVQTNTAQRPALLYEAWPGHQVVGFDGVDDVMVLENSAGNARFEGELTVFYVGRTTGGSFLGTGGFIGNFQTGTGYKNGWTLRAKSDGGYGFLVGNAAWNEVTGGKGLIGGDFVLLNARYSDDGDGTGTMELFSSLVPDAGTAGTSPFTLSASSVGITIGMFCGWESLVANQAAGCDVAEIRIYDQALSEADRQSIWAELSAKYDVATTQAIEVKNFQPTGYDVSAETPIEITFSEAMNPDSVTNVIVGIGGLDGLPESNTWARAAGQWAASASNTVFTFTPNSAFMPGNLVMCEIPTNVISAGGTPYLTVPRETFSFLIDNGVSYAVTTNLIDPMAVVLHDNGDPHDLPLELFIPDTPQPCPVMFWVHGGGWNGGNSGTWERSGLTTANMAYYFAEKLGVAVANVAWRSQDNSDGTFTKATNDVELAIQYVMDHAGTLGIDTSRMGLYGGSAGTPTSALVAQANTNISCYIGFNGLYDFVNRVPPYGFGGGTSFGQNVPSLAANSAALNVRVNPPDTLLLHGSADTTIEHQQSLQFATAVQAAGGHAETLIYRDEVHAFFNKGRPMHLPTLHAASRHLMEVFGLSYGLWAKAHALSGGPLDNDDGDSLDNLSEYGLGGNPTNPVDIGILPTFGSSGNVFEYIYRRRTAPESGVGYQVELTDNLVSNAWKTTGYTETGSGDIDGIFKSVTNEIPTLGKTNEFIRLRIYTE